LCGSERTYLVIAVQKVSMQSSGETVLNRGETAVVQSTKYQRKVNRTVDWLLSVLTVLLTVAFFLATTLARSFVHKPLGDTSVHVGLVFALACLALFIAINLIFTFVQTDAHRTRDRESNTP
jgi:uncharacterized membrane protein (DUF485 family)